MEAMGKLKKIAQQQNTHRKRKIGSITERELDNKYLSSALKKEEARGARLSDTLTLSEFCDSFLLYEEMCSL